MEVVVNDISLHYELYGQGSPIILLHGNREDNSIFDKLIEKLKENYTVYAIDSRCHGNSSDTKEISYEEYKEKIENKESFALLIWRTGCSQKGCHASVPGP